MEGYYLLGYVARPHGIKGVLKLKVETDFPEKYRKLKHLTLKLKHKVQHFEVQSVSYTPPDEMLVSLKQISNRNAAEEWRGAEVWVSMDFLPKLEGKSFYFHEVIGFEVRDVVLGSIGKIELFYETAAHPIIAVNHQGKEVLIPAVDEFIVELNRDERYMIVSLPQNWLEIYED
ncbi:MAG: ribosome maturation factor RimM [Bacteroidia bacterium]|nr:ribosome maturation factor RimM [Bacteroidia bacterium]MDW8301699.1 ribosome maturation factor RimM [Bacteroidia bacterium]